MEVESREREEGVGEDVEVIAGDPLLWSGTGCPESPHPQPFPPLLYLHPSGWLRAHPQHWRPSSGCFTQSELRQAPYKMAARRAATYQAFTAVHAEA